MKKSVSPLYPVNLDISGKCCLVAGGGAVAARKIKALLLCGGIVRIISPEVCAEIEELSSSASVTWFRRTYRSGDAEDAFLVFAATDDPAAQQRIAEDARRYHVLLNSADGGELCDFHVPAKLRRRDFVITVSTGGGSPALAALLKAQLAEDYGEEYGVLVELMARIRCRVITDDRDAGENRELFKAILDLPVLASIKCGDWTGLKEILDRVLPPGLDSSALVDELVADMKALQTNG